MNKTLTAVLVKKTERDLPLHAALSTSLHFSIEVGLKSLQVQVRQVVRILLPRLETVNVGLRQVDGVVP